MRRTHFTSAPAAPLGPARLFFLTSTLTLGLCAWPAQPASAWVDPTTGLPHATRVTRPAEIPERNWLPGHRGVDLGMGNGGQVLAAADGVVVFSGVVVGVPTLSIEHPGGMRTTYQPVHSRLRKGDRVREGEAVGKLVRNRDHDGLHWGALVAKDTYIDPLTLLDAPVIRLKPVAAAVTPGGGPARRRP